MPIRRSIAENVYVYPERRVEYIKKWNNGPRKSKHSLEQEQKNAQTENQDQHSSGERSPLADIGAGADPNLLHVEQPGIGNALDGGGQRSDSGSAREEA
mgnify:CR=1 FL=1